MRVLVVGVVGLSGWRAHGVRVALWRAWPRGFFVETGAGEKMENFLVSLRVIFLFYRLTPLSNLIPGREQLL